MNVDPVIGFRPNQHVYVQSRGPNPPFHGTVVKVIVPAKGERIVIVVDGQGGAHYRDFHDIAAIEFEAA